jgi:hypothetical protein
MMRLPCWQESSARRGGDHLGAILSVVTPPTSPLTAPRERSLTPLISTTTPTGTTTTRVTTGRRTTSEIEEEDDDEEEEEVLEDHVPSMCYLERLQLLD